MPLYIDEMDAGYFQFDNSLSTGSRVSLWVAVLISVIIHIFILLISKNLHRTPSVTQLNNRGFNVVLRSPVESVGPPVMESDSSKSIISKSSAAPQRKEPKEFQGDAIVTTKHSPKAIVLPNRDTVPHQISSDSARVSILDSAKNIISSEMTTNNFSHGTENLNVPDGYAGNIFNPALRHNSNSARARTESRQSRVEALNTSNSGDSQEFASSAGKCFRMENLGGRVDQRAWYRIKCIGEEITSDAMHRGLLENLKNR